MKEFILLVIIIVAILYEVVISPIICKHMIIEYLLKIDGQFISMESLLRRDTIYLVKYELKGEVQKATVKFSIIYNMEWK